MQQDAIRIPYRIPYEILIFEENETGYHRIPYFFKKISTYIFFSKNCGILFQFYWIQVFHMLSCVVSWWYPVHLFCRVKESKRLKLQEETSTDRFKVLSKSLSLHLLLINFCLWNFKNKLKYVVWFKFSKVCLNWSCEKLVDMLLTTRMQSNFRP